jgi:predicted transcriptional regulator
MFVVNNGRVTSEQARHNEELAWQLRIKGWTTTRIAQELQIQQPAVSKILQRVEARAIKQLDAEIGGFKVRQATQLEHMLDEALQAWEKSKTAKCPGNVEYLEAALKVQADLRDLLHIGAANNPGTVGILLIQSGAAGTVDMDLITGAKRVPEMIEGTVIHASDEEEKETTGESGGEKQRAV